MEAGNCLFSGKMGFHAMKLGLFGQKIPQIKNGNASSYWLVYSKSAAVLRVVNKLVANLRISRCVGTESHLK